MRLMCLWGGTTWLKVDADGAWYAARTREGGATVRINHGGDHIAAEAWGPGATALLDEVPALVGLDRPPLSSLSLDHPVLAGIARRHPGVRVARSGRVYPRLVSAALAQKVTGKNSKQALQRLARRFGERPPGPRDDLRLLPAPRDLAAIPYYQLHSLGIERHRAALIARVARRAPALQRAASMPPAQARAHLEKLPGIGPWTSGVVMGGPLGDPDAVPLADVHLPNLVAHNLAGEPRADDARMMQLLEPFAGHRGTVVRLLKTRGAAAPRYGPRAPVREIRDM